MRRDGWSPAHFHWDCWFPRSRRRAVGRLADRGQGPAVMQAGGLLAAGLLIAWAAGADDVDDLRGVGRARLVHGLDPLRAGVCDRRPRLRGSGRASTRDRNRHRDRRAGEHRCFSPARQPSCTRFGWRGAVAILAIIIAVTTVIVGQFAFRDLAWSAQTIRDAIAGVDRVTTRQRAAARPRPHGRRFSRCRSSSIRRSRRISSASLIDRGLAPTFAATVAGSFGIMQLPGRLLLSNARVVATTGAAARFELRAADRRTAHADGPRADRDVDRRDRVCRGNWIDDAGAAVPRAASIRSRAIRLRQWRHRSRTAAGTGRGSGFCGSPCGINGLWCRVRRYSPRSWSQQPCSPETGLNRPKSLTGFDILVNFLAGLLK